MSRSKKDGRKRGAHKTHGQRKWAVMDQRRRYRQRLETARVMRMEEAAEKEDEIYDYMEMLNTFEYETLESGSDFDWYDADELYFEAHTDFHRDEDYPYSDGDYTDWYHRPDSLEDQFESIFAPRPERLPTDAHVAIDRLIRRAGASMAFESAYAIATMYDVSVDTVVAAIRLSPASQQFDLDRVRRRQRSFR